jgi:flagellar motor switch protein FliM
MPVRAEWDALSLSLREVNSLQVGDVVELPSSLMQDTRILLNGSHKFSGTVGLDTDRVAVQITRKISPTNEESTHRLK